MSADADQCGTLCRRCLKHFPGHSIQGHECIPEGRADLRYELFGRLVWKMILDIGGDFCGDEWSEDVLPLAQRAGLCRRVTYDPVKHGDGIEAEPGDSIWFWGDEP